MSQSTHQTAEQQAAARQARTSATSQTAGLEPQAVSLDVAAAAQARNGDARALTPQNVTALQRVVGNAAVQRMIQAKLTVNAPGDAYEQEADRVAAQVMTMPEPARPLQRHDDDVQAKALVQRDDAPEEDELSTKPMVQRVGEEDELSMKPLVQRAGEEDELSMKPLVQREGEEDELSMKPLVQREGEEDELAQTKPMIQRASTDGGFETNDDFQARLSGTQGGGSTLPAETRNFMEPRFGADFSGVRVHTGGEAAQLNREVQAQAFTHGSNIYFNEGKYNPASSDGQQLLAHELTHVVQQTGAQQKESEKE